MPDDVADSRLETGRQVGSQKEEVSEADVDGEAVGIGGDGVGRAAAGAGVGDVCAVTTIEGFGAAAELGYQDVLAGCLHGLFSGWLRDLGGADYVNRPAVLSAATTAARSARLALMAAAMASSSSA